MFQDIISKFAKKRKPECLLITPPLLDTDGIYAAMPVLTGQLIKHGYNAQNLDLNIKFFRAVFTKEYLLKTKGWIDFNKIEYDKEKINYCINNIENIVKNYRTLPMDIEEFKKAEKNIEEVMKFVSLPYKNFNLNMRMVFDCFNGFGYTYENLQKITEDRENNIFIEYFEAEAEKIKKSGFNFIGITIPFIGTLIPALTLLKILKKKTNAYIAIGGNFLKYEDLKNHPDFFDTYCDSVLIGEGEESIIKLVQAFENKKSHADVPGLIYKDKKNNIIFNEPELVLNLNELANMSYEGLDLNEYMREFPAVDIMLSKGCYWGKCEFCSLAPKYKKYRIKTPKRAVSDIIELKQKYKNLGTIRFQDDSLPPAYLDKLADEIIKADLKIDYFVFARLEKEFTKELFEKLHKSGLWNIFWGLESGSQSVLEKMNKGIKKETASRVLKDAYEAGIHSLCGIIVNFPKETMEEFNETLDFLKKIRQYTDIAPGNFTVMKGSTIIQKQKEFGIKVSGAKEFSYDTEWQDLNITPEERWRRWENFRSFVKEMECSIDKNKKL